MGNDSWKWTLSTYKHNFFLTFKTLLCPLYCLATLKTRMYCTSGCGRYGLCSYWRSREQENQGLRGQLAAQNEKEVRPAYANYSLSTGVQLPWENTTHAFPHQGKNPGSHFSLILSVATCIQVLWISLSQQFSPKSQRKDYCVQGGIEVGGKRKRGSFFSVVI